MKPELVSKEHWMRYNLYFAMEHFIGRRNSEKFLRNAKGRLFKEVGSDPGLHGRGRTLDPKCLVGKDTEKLLEDRTSLKTQPMVFRGAAKHWKCSKKWSNQFFGEHYAKTEVALIDNPGLVDAKGHNEFRQINFEKYFDESRKDSSKYLRFSRVLDNNPELLEDLDLSWLRNFKHGQSIGELTFLFIGESGTITPMHAGFSHTLFVQVKGRKKWVICAPEERLFLDPVADRRSYFYTEANMLQADDPAFPLLPFLRKWEVVLEEGDILWLPSLFWHHVENLTPTIGVAYKYADVKASFEISKLLTTLFFMATKPTIVRSVLHNIKHKQDLVFSTSSRT